MDRSVKIVQLEQVCGSYCVMIKGLMGGREAAAFAMFVQRKGKHFKY